MVYGFWHAQLSGPIKSKIAGQKFNKDTYKDLFKQADEVHNANGGSAPAVVAALQSSTPQTSSETPQIAAVSTRGRGGGRGGRGGRGGGNRGGGQSNQNSQTNSTNTSNQSQSNNRKPHQKGPQHADLPANAWWACAQHWKKGSGAPYCSDPHVCKWVNKCAPRTPSSNSSST